MRAFFAYAVALPIVGGIVTCLATYLGWFAVGALIWWPFWRQMRGLGMYFDDISASYLLAFGPLVVGGLFVLTTCVSLIVFLIVHKSKYCFPLFALPNLFPAIAVFASLNLNQYVNISHSRMWHFPLTETIVLFVGIGWSVVSLKVLRRAAAS